MGKIKSINWVIQNDLKLGIRTKKKPKLGNTGHSSVHPPLAYKDAHLCCRVKCMGLVNVVMCLFPILNNLDIWFCTVLLSIKFSLLTNVDIYSCIAAYFQKNISLFISLYLKNVITALCVCI